MRISKKYRLTAAAMLAASSVVTVAPGLSHANSMYKDVSPSASYYKDLVELVNQGVISGYADKTFKPDVAVTRGHFAQMLAQLLKLETSKVNDPYLSDVKSSNPFYKYIAALAGAGVDLAYEDGSFKPNQAITRVEAAQMLATALDLKPTTGTANYTDVPAKNQEAVKAVVQNGLMKAPSSKNFNSNGTISRAESVSLLTGIQAFQQDEGTFTFNSLTSAGQVSTSEGTYRLSAEMKKIFNSSNAAALSGAQIKAVISNKQIIKVTGITFNQSGSTYGAVTFNTNGAKIEGNVFINADYLRLQNVKINGNVTVSDEVSYNLTFDNVTVKQSVVIEDGYSSSFTFAANNSTMPQLYVKRDNTLVNANQKITAIVIEGDADDVALNTKVGKVTIAAGMYPTITGYATIDEMIVERGADADLRFSGNLAKLEVAHEDSTVYSNRNLLIADVLIPRGADYTDIIANYSIVNNYIMSIQRPGSTGNLLGIDKVPNIPDGVLHPGAGGGGDGSNTGMSFDRAVARAIASFSAVPSGKSVTLTTKFNSMDDATKKTLGEASYNYRIRSTTPLVETAKYTLEIENWDNTYTATVTGKQLNEGIKMEYLILKALGQATNMSDATDTWTISVKTLNGTLDLRADLLIKDTVAKSAIFALTGTDTNAGEDGGDKPGAGEGDKPGTGDGDKPGTGGGDKPGIGEGDKPGEGKDPVTGPGDETAEEAKPIADLLESYLVSGKDATLNISTKFKEMDETFTKEHGDKTYDYKVTATNLSGVSPDKEFKIIVNNGSTKVEKNIKASDLTGSVYVSGLVNKRNLGKLSSLSNNTDTTSIQFVGLDTVVELQVELLADDAVVRLMTDKVAGSYENAAKEAVTFDVGASSNEVTLKANYGTILKELLGEAKINPKLKITNVGDLTDQDKLNVSFYLGDKEVDTIDIRVSQLKNGISLDDYYAFAKLATKTKGTFEQLRIVFNNLEGTLTAEVQGIVTRNDKSDVVITKSDLTITKSNDAFLKEQARDAVEQLEIPGEKGDGKGSVADNILKFTTHFTEKSKDVAAVVDYKIKVSSSSIVKPQENQLFNLVIHHNGTPISNVTATGKELIDGFLLGDKVGKDKLVRYANMKPGEDGKDDWLIEIAELNIMTTFDIELFANNVSLHDATKDTLPKYKKSLTLKQTAVEETLINQLINEFRVVKKEDNKVTIEANFESNILHEKGITADIMVSTKPTAFSVLKDREIASQKDVRITITDAKGENEHSIKPNVSSFSSTSSKPVNLGLKAPLMDFSGGKYIITIEFDDIYSEQKMDFSLKVDNKVYRTIPDVTINEGNSSPIFSELDMAIRGFTAEVIDPSNSPILEVNTTFGDEKDSGGKTYVDTTKLGAANLDARITLPEDWKEAPDGYIVKGLEIELDDKTVNTSKKEIKIGELKKGVLLSDLLGGKGKLVEQLVANNDKWEIKAEEFVFAADMNVELLLTDIKAPNTPNILTIRKVPVTFTDRNEWANYNDDILVSTTNSNNGDATVSFKFAHKLPNNFYQGKGTNPKETPDEYKKRVLGLLFKDWKNENISDYSKVKINKKNIDNIENTLEVVFEAGAFKEEIGVTTPTLLGYTAHKLQLNDKKVFKNKPEDTDNLKNVYLVFKKDLSLVKTAENSYYPFSAKFVNQSDYDKLEADRTAYEADYKKTFNGFDVTFTPSNEVTGEKNILKVTTKFKDTNTEAIKDRGLDAKITLGKGDFDDTKDFEMYISFNGSSEMPFTVKGKQLKDGVNLSTIIKRANLPKIGTHSSGRTDEWEIKFESPIEGKYPTTISLVSYALDNDGKPNLSTEHVIYSKTQELDLKK